VDTQAEIFWWAAALIIGVPIAIVALGELASRLRSSNSAYLVPVELARSVLMPTVVLYLMVRRLFTVDVDRSLTRIATTIVLVAIAYVGFILLRLISREKRQDRWENKVPSLFKIMLRIGIVVVPTMLMFDTWGIDLSSNLGALGIGGLAVAFALQDAIGNVVSGILLVLDRPFTVGDWIEVDGLHGQVIDISWRSTRISVAADIVILPNTTLSGSSIRNLTAVDPSHESAIEFSFSRKDRPSDVKAMLLEVANDNPKVSTVIPAEVHTLAFAGSSVTYSLNYHTDEYESDLASIRIQDQLRSAVFYAHQRHGLTMPSYPISIHLGKSALAKTPLDAEKVQAFLAVNSLFSRLPEDVRQSLAASAELRVYHVAETMLRPDIASREIQIIKSGEANMRSSAQPKMAAAAIALSAGDIIGEQALVSSTSDDWQVQASTDVEVYVIDVDLMQAVVEQHHRFAMSMNDLMNRRAKWRHDAIAPPLSRPALNAVDDAEATIDLRSNVPEQAG